MVWGRQIDIPRGGARHKQLMSAVFVHCTAAVERGGWLRISMEAIRITNILRRLSALWLLLLLKGVLSVSPVPDTHPLYHALHRFDVLHKDHLSHRSITKAFRELRFTTLDRNFRLYLTPRRRLFHKNVHVYIVKQGGERRKHGIHFERFYEGHLIGEPESTVTAHLDHERGLLTASISTQHDHYYIEPSHRHISESHDFHMISYRASDLKYNLTRHPSEHFCGTPAHHPPELLPTQHLWHSDSSQHQDFQKTSFDHDRVADEAVSSRKERDRLKRQSSPPAVIKDSCPMHLVATHSFISTYGVEDAIQFMIQVIDDVDRAIFRSTHWAEDLVNLGLSIRNITIHDVASGPGEEPIYNQLPPPGGWNSNTLLSHFSHANWSQFCLSYLFTSERFSDGRLGVAYIASPTLGLTGGICSETLLNFNNAPITTANVGISSLYNEGRRLLLAEAILITAHEIGHSWGSDHDPIDSLNQCNPSLDNGGKYLMYQSANDGTLPNNRQFSVCSQASVELVLTAKSSRCFIPTAGDSLCGNYEVEDDEDCDGGLEGMFGLEDCCNSNCKLRGTANCSDVNDNCCSGCQYANSSTVCMEYAPGNFQCLENVKCTGSDKKCPVDQRSFVPVESPCRGNGRCYPPESECASGLCTSPSENSTSLKCFNFCELHGMIQCFCTDDNDCKTCCTSQANDSVCQPFQLLGESQPRNLPDGTSCVGGVCHGGTCDVTNPDFVTRLFRLFTDISIDEVVRFMRENIVLTVVFLIALVWFPGALLVHCCIDVKVWQKFVEHADQSEQEKLTLNQEDDLDFAHCAAIAQDYPDINVAKARMGLQRMASRTESVYGYDSFSGLSFPSPQYTADCPPVYDLESPMRPGTRGHLPIIAEENLDPSRDNIRKYMSASVQSDSTLETQV